MNNDNNDCDDCNEIMWVWCPFYSITSTSLFLPTTHSSYDSYYDIVQTEPIEVSYKNS